jgi:hypothetical protein
VKYKSTAMVASTWLGDHQERPSAPLIQCVKPLEHGELTNILKLEPAKTFLKDWANFNQYNACLRIITQYL